MASYMLEWSFEFWAGNVNFTGLNPDERLFYSKKQPVIKGRLNICSYLFEFSNSCVARN